jgi:predicted phage terminase large subunit-like protein
MAETLDRVRRGETRRLIMTLPPRHLKSIVTSVAWPAYLLGQDPSRKFICASYSMDLAIKHANDFRAVMESDQYRRIFPGTHPGRKNTETDFMTSQRGGRFATAVGGTLTGRGGDTIICDDLMKPEQAHSAAFRESTRRWIESTLFSRLDDKMTGSIVVVQQRLHAEDPVGVLLEKGGWDHLDLPAIAQEHQEIRLYGGRIYRRRPGDVLDEKREPLWKLEELRRDKGSTAFNSEYLQRPTPPEGNLIKRAWLNYYDQMPQQKTGDHWVVSLDTALKISSGSDYTVATVWRVSGDYCYLVDLVRERLDFPGLIATVRALRGRYPDASILIEDKGSGTSLIQELRHQTIAVIPIQVATDKLVRLYACEAMFEAGSVLFPRRAPWLDALVTELMGFPGGKHDDIVDSVSQALTWIRQRRARMQFEGPLFITSVQRSYSETNGVRTYFDIDPSEWDSDYY